VSGSAWEDGERFGVEVEVEVEVEVSGGSGSGSGSGSADLILPSAVPLLPQTYRRVRAEPPVDHGGARAANGREGSSSRTTGGQVSGASWWEQ
jgi:hypothetical protein